MHVSLVKCVRSSCQCTIDDIYAAVILNISDILFYSHHLLSIHHRWDFESCESIRKPKADWQLQPLTFIGERSQLSVKQCHMWAFYSCPCPKIPSTIESHSKHFRFWFGSDANTVHNITIHTHTHKILEFWKSKSPYLVCHGIKSNRLKSTRAMANILLKIFVCKMLWMQTQSEHTVFQSHNCANNFVLSPVISTWLRW